MDRREGEHDVTLVPKGCCDHVRQKPHLRGCGAELTPTVRGQEVPELAIKLFRWKSLCVRGWVVEILERALQLKIGAEELSQTRIYRIAHSPSCFESLREVRLRERNDL